MKSGMSVAPESQARDVLVPQTKKHAIRAGHKKVLEHSIIANLHKNTLVHKNEA